MERLVPETACVLALASGLALAVNALSPAGIAVTRRLPLTDLDPRYLTSEETKDLFDRGGQVLFVDARKAEEFGKGHIEAALNLPAEDFTQAYPSVGPLMPQDVLVVVYCGGSDCALSRQLADRLREVGYDRVKIFRGGWKEWRERRWPSEP